MARGTTGPRLSGSLVALVTPMHDDGSVAWESLDGLVDWHIEQGTHGLVAVGTTGESATLNVDEHARVIERVIRRAQRRIPVIAGTGANSTQEAIELTKTAKQLGADAALLVTTYYNKPTQDGLYRHYRAIAEAVELPQMLYNVPGRTGVDMINTTVERLADVPNVTAIKDATGDLVRGQDLLDRVGDRLDVFSGDDATAFELILRGARGNVSVTANVAPRAMSAVCSAALAGNRDQAERENAPISSLHQLLFCESNPIPVKWALHLMGRIPAGIRLPLTTLDNSYQSAMRQALIDSAIL